MIRNLHRSIPLAVLVVTAALAMPTPSRADATGNLMADAAGRFLAALDDAQRAEASFAFDSPERVNWHWIPRERRGVPIKAMRPEQRALAFGLMSTGLSSKGMVTATTAMSMEEILRIDENGTGPVRDPELYFFSVFGTPGQEGSWAWRVEGHHLALNFTLKDGVVVSATPFMFGANPATVKKEPRKGLRNLADIEKPIYALVASLDEAQKKAAIVSDQVPDVNNGPNPAEVELPSPRGLSSDRMTAEQKELLSRFVRAYHANFAWPIREAMNARTGDGDPVVHLAWFGPADPSRPFAFQVQGPDLLIDFNDKQNAANHIHTFYRSKAGDFGGSVPR
jgi:hypothetical protein